MVTTMKSFLFLLLCATFLISVADAQWHQVHRDDLCDIYNEDWSCDAQQVFHSGKAPSAPGRLIPTPVDDYELCEADLVGTTLALLAEGDEKIELTKNEEAVLVIGNTGTGKTTLTYFLAGNNSALISYYVDDYNNLIKDCNGKIGDSTIISQTMFPDLVVEEVTETAFYDNPGFLDTRTPCLEIAHAYFINKVVNHLKMVKVVIAVNHQSVTPLSERGEFVRSLKNVLSFIPNLQKFLPSVALIGTKARGEGQPISVRVKQMSQFLTKNQQSIPLEFPEPTSTMVFNLISTLNETNAQGNFTRMNVFRVPEECGPLSDIEHMQQNRRDMIDIVMNNLIYTEISPDDFGYSLSADAQLSIYQITREIDQRSKSSLLNLTSALNSTKLEELSSLGVYEKRESLKSYIFLLEGAESILAASLESGPVKTNIFLKQLLDALVGLGLNKEIAQNYSDSLVSLFQFFDSMGSPSFIDEVDSAIWLSPLTTFHSQMLMEEKWNDFLINLWLDLSHFDYQSGNKGNLKLWWQTGDNSIILPTFSSFWDRFNTTSAIYSRNKREFTAILETDTGVKLKGLNDLLSTSLGDSFQCHLTSSDTIANVTGNFVTFSEIFTKSCLTTGVTKTVTVFATHSIFIDLDFSGAQINTASNVDLIVISPTVWYSPTNVINLDGATGLPGDSSGSAGAAGGPGKPGGKAGNLISMGQYFQGAIKVSARGGRGGNGAAGQKGQSGGDGGHGGRSGIGGKGGHLYSVLVASGLQEDRTEVDGVNGDMGVGGPAGEGVGGNNGITGGNPLAPQNPTPQQFNPSSVSTYFLQYKTSAQWKEPNQFLGSVVTDFVSKGNQIFQ